VSRSRTLAALLALSFAVCAAGASAAPAKSPAKAPAKDPVEARYTPGYQPCLEKPEGQSTAGMIDCIGAELKVQDARLNATYRKDLAALNPRQKLKLQAAQRAWLAFRNAECASFQDEEWGTISRINANGCVLTMTVRRTIDLENYPPG
jgi:uncharacterized protein YecT (DUF1311 family)